MVPIAARFSMLVTGMALIAVVAMTPLVIAAVLFIGGSIDSPVSLSGTSVAQIASWIIGACAVVAVAVVAAMARAVAHARHA